MYGHKSGQVSVTARADQIQNNNNNKYFLKMHKSENLRKVIITKKNC